MLFAELLTQWRLKAVRTHPPVPMLLHTLMMTRRALLGAPKCAFRDLRRELARDPLTVPMLLYCWRFGGKWKISNPRSANIEVRAVCRHQPVSLLSVGETIVPAAPVARANRAARPESLSSRVAAPAHRVNTPEWRASSAYPPGFGSPVPTERVVATKGITTTSEESM